MCLFGMYRPAKGPYNGKRPSVESHVSLVSFGIRVSRLLFCPEHPCILVCGAWKSPAPVVIPISSSCHVRYDLSNVAVGSSLRGTGVDDCHVLF